MLSALTLNRFLRGPLLTQVLYWFAFLVLLVPVTVYFLQPEQVDYAEIFPKSPDVIPAGSGVYLPGGTALDAGRDSVLAVVETACLDSAAYRETTVWYNDESNWKPWFGDFSVVAFYLQRRAEQLENAGQYRAAAKIYLALGRMASQPDDYSNAATLSSRALGIAHGLGDSLLIGWGMMQMAVSQNRGVDSLAASSNFPQALALARRYDDKELEILTLVNQAVALSIGGHPEQALAHTQLAYDLMRADTLYHMESYAITNLAIAFTSLKRFTESERLIVEYLSRRTALSPLAEASMYLTLARTYRRSGELTKAETATDRACELATKHAHRFNRLYCFGSRIRLYDQLDMVEKKLEVYEGLTYFQEIEKVAIAQKNLLITQLTELVRTDDFARENDLRDEQQFQMLEQVRWSRTLNYTLIVASLIIMALLLVMGWQKMVQVDRRKRYTEMKIRALRAQMNPHFMFNTINGIQNKILQADNLEAYNYLGSFAEMLRMVTKAGSEVRVELEEEIKFLRTYLDLEKRRFRDAFDYSIEVAPELLNRHGYIPSMMIQPFVENAILHGLSVLDYPGVLTVMFTPVSDGVRCVVRDNGRGRAAGTRRSSLRGKDHLSITGTNVDARVQSLQESGYFGTEVTINDLYDNGRPVGTEVVLILPFLKSSNPTP